MSWGIRSLCWMVEGWGVEPLLVAGLVSAAHRERSSVSSGTGTAPHWQVLCCTQALQGSPGGGWSLPQLLPGTLPRSCTLTGAGARRELVACLRGAEVLLGWLPESG